MAFRYRAMRLNDVTECAGIVADHPVIGARYGPAIKDLPAAWLRHLGCEAMDATVFEETNGSRTRTYGVGVSVCVPDSVMREMKMHPLAWIGPALTMRIKEGRSPVLSDKQLREANSSAGLNSLVWECCVLPEYEQRPETYPVWMRAFVETHSGYWWKEVVAQMATSEQIAWALETGGKLWDPAFDSYDDSPTEALEEVAKRPHIIGVTRDMESNRFGTWIGALFRYSRPRVGFSRSEQQLLFAALDGLTDEELSERLHVSLTTVKKAWGSIYERTAARLPDLIPVEYSGNGTARRGREKRRPLLAYVRDHPEELRPISRRRH